MSLSFEAALSAAICSLKKYFTMSEKVAVVTGANKGIGFAIVKGLCEKFEGIVYLTSRDETRGLEAVDKLQKLGFTVRYHQLDISDENSIRKFCEYIRNTHNHIDILVNNAGVLFGNNSEFSLIRQANEILQVNYKSLVNFCTQVVPLIRNGGRIVNISSSSGHLSRIPSDELKKRFLDANLSTEDLNKLVNEYLECVENGTASERWGDSPYVVSKVANNAYTFILQRENAASDLKVNCVHPGYVATDMTAHKGNLTPEQGAAAPLFVALRCNNDVKGKFFWHNCDAVQWDGPDPRVYIDNKC